MNFNMMNWSWVGGLGAFFLLVIGTVPIREAEASGAEDGVWLYAPEGDPFPGEVIPLEVHLDGHAGDLEPALMARQGVVELVEGKTAQGTWGYRYRAPTEPGVPMDFVVAIGDRELEFSMNLASALHPAIEVEELIEAMVRPKEAISIPVTAHPGFGEKGKGVALDSSSLDFVVAEGEVVGVREEGEQIFVEWMPDDDPFPRAVPIGIQDRRFPRRPPSWTVVRLRAFPRIPVQTEPGTEVRVRIGIRRYGPFVADESGIAITRVEVLPGEERAEVVLVDSVGNEQRSAIALGGNPHPSLVGMVDGPLVSGRRPPVVNLLAVHASGRAWKGTPPTCMTSLGEDAEPVSGEQGRWRVYLPHRPDKSFFDLRVDCDLGSSATTSIRVPVEAAVPARLVLQTYPQELSTDLPLAQVQVTLENHHGDRLPVQDISLEATHGSLSVDTESDPAVLRADYLGDQAAPFGGDVVTASWNAAEGEGGVWDLRMELGLGKDGT
ncbi:MAG: hypothetical protein QGG40_17520, partial [Myxococcota bacterium]|nr:hypothetical protein [Myxococcota bacterium]